MGLLYIAFFALLGLAAAALLYAAARVLVAAFDRTAAKNPGALVRRVLAVAAALAIILPLTWAFLRDGYRNMLCDSEAGLKTLVSPQDWVPVPVASNRVSATPAPAGVVRLAIESNLAEDYTMRQRGLGVRETRHTFVDVSSGVALASVTAFHTGSTGRSIVDWGLPPAKSCLAARYIETRSSYVERVRQIVGPHRSQ
jgi:hypothetical protein